MLWSTVFYCVPPCYAVVFMLICRRHRDPRPVWEFNSQATGAVLHFVRIYKKHCCWILTSNKCCFHFTILRIPTRCTLENQINITIAIPKFSSWGCWPFKFHLLFFSSFFWRVAAIFAGLALFTGIHGYKPRLYAFSPAQSGCQQSGATWTHCAGCYQPLIFPPNFSNFPLCWLLPTFDFYPQFFQFSIVLVVTNLWFFPILFPYFGTGQRFTYALYQPLIFPIQFPPFFGTI